jgi:guanylate kinase
MVSTPAQQDEIKQVVSSIQSRRGMAVVISAPSGTGKTTVCEQLVAVAPELSLSVSYTTRRPRAGEKDGTHYYFVSKKKFREELERGEFLEWAKVHGHYYGTPRGYLEERIRAGRDTILDIDVQGARAIKEALDDAVLIFLVPPSRTELRRRLKGRKSDSPADIDTRLGISAREFSCYPLYDYLVLNSNTDEAVGDLQAIIRAERCRTSRVKP